VHDTAPRTAELSVAKGEAFDLMSSALRDGLFRGARRLVGGLLVLALILLTALPRSGSLFAAPCVTSSVAGLDTTQPVCSYPVEFGSAMGQTFLATDTIIQAITVWRWAPWDTNFSVWRMHVLELDSTGVPDPHKEIRSGPTLIIPYSDGVHQTPFRFFFDPPVVLPYKGYYEFAVQGDSCGAFFDVAGSCSDEYPNGEMWYHGRVLYDCHLRSGPQPYPSLDLFFAIEFCSASTPALGQTWGAIKARYR